MKKSLRIIGIALAVIIVLGTFWFLWRQSQPQEVSYEILSPERRTLSKKTVATGKVEPRDEVNVKPQIQGIISELYVEPGDRIAAGEPIARIKVIPEMASLNSHQSQVRTAQLTLEETEREHARIEDLYNRKVVSREEYEKSLNNLQKVREQAQAAQDQLDIAVSGISSRSGKVNTTLVTSTVNGTVLDVPVKMGTAVISTSSFSDGTTVATVADMSDIIFRGNIDETEVGRLRTGMGINLTIGALQSVVLPARLEYISPKGTESNGAVLFEIKAAATIPDTLLIRAGYSANAEIILDSRDSVLSIPESAVEFKGDSAFVYQLTSNPDARPQTFERKPVTIGLSDGIYVEVTGGIDPSDRLRGNENRPNG